MKGCLVVLGLVMIAGFVYVNHAQNEMATRPAPTPPTTVPAAGPDLDEVVRVLRAADGVLVEVTPESLEAVHEAVRADPDATVFTLGVSLEDRLHPLERAAADGSVQRASALIVYTSEERLPPDTPFRTDTPLGVLDSVAARPDVDYVVLNPASTGPGGPPPATVLGPDELAALRQRLTSPAGDPGG